MGSFITLAVVVLLIVGVVEFLKLTNGSKSSQTHSTVPMYRTKGSVMNKSEQAFFYELQKQLPEGYHVFPNMRIADILEAIDGKGFYNRRNKILPKHIDFLICDRYFKPVVAIEINGSSHRRPDRIESDNLKREIFKDANLPLEFVDVGTSFEQSVQRIKDLLLVK